MTETRALDRTALTRLYDEHSPGLYRYAYRLLGSQELAEECVSETFTRFLERTRRRTPHGNLRAYLYRIVHNWVVDHYRAQHNTEPIEDDLLSGEEAGPETRLLVQAGQEQLRRALLALPEEQRMVIELRFMEDWSHEQVAEYLGRSSVATRALQHRALNTLRKSLRQVWNERI